MKLTIGSPFAARLGFWSLTIAGLLFVLGFCLLFTGCSDKPVAPSSSLPAQDARNAAKAVALLTRGQVCAVAPTGSMRPTFDSNAMLVTEPVAMAAVHPGDIIVRTDGVEGRLIVHRVVRIAASGAVTRGDANGEDDAGFVDDAKLKGRVVAIVYGAR